MWHVAFFLLPIVLFLFQRISNGLIVASVCLRAGFLPAELSLFVAQLAPSIGPTQDSPLHVASRRVTNFLVFSVFVLLYAFLEIVEKMDAGVHGCMVVCARVVCQQVLHPERNQKVGPG